MDLACQTRTKLKEAFDIHTAAIIERCEKQIILARHARRLLNFIDDSPVVPGDTRQAYDHEFDARHILEDAEADLRAWGPNLDPISTSAVNEPTDVTGGGVNQPEQETESVATGPSGVAVGNAVPSSSRQPEEPVA